MFSNPALFAALSGTSWTPAALFSVGEQGVWYDPSDFSTMFQDSAGTTPVTAVEQPVGLILDKSGRGNHASQSTTTARPVLSARVNLLVNTSTLSTQSVTTIATNYTLVFSGAGSITLSGTATGTYNAGINAITCTAGTLTLTVSGAVTNADFRVANIGVGLPAYQRVGAATSGSSSSAGNGDYDTSGFPLYLRFDGADDFLTTSSINPGSVNTAQIVSGVRKLSDSVGFVAQTGTSTATGPGVLALYANGGDMYVRSGGTTVVSLAGDAGATESPTPTTGVYVALASIAAPSLIHRRNASQRNTSTASQGTGDYQPYAFNFGGRSGGGYFNGHVYNYLMRYGAALTADQLSKIETWANAKTRAY